MATMSQYFILDHLYQPRDKKTKPQEKFRTQIVILQSLRQKACESLHDSLGESCFNYNSQHDF